MCSNSRWNPSKEQIDMLEGFYKAGIKTPSAAEIQDMTSKLRVYGDIEGKNVFYWFQNHKARQKQRQVRHAYAYDPKICLINRQQFFIRNQISSPKGSALYPSPYTNVTSGHCSSKGSPYYVPAGPGTYPVPSYAHQHQNPKLPLPPRSTIIARSSTNVAYPNIQLQPVHNNSHQGVEYINYEQKQAMACNSSSTSSVETLPLFPIHPTGILQSKNKEKYDSGSSNSSSTTISLCAISSTNLQEQYDANTEQSGGSRQFFDFFATH